MMKKRKRVLTAAALIDFALAMFQMFQFGVAGRWWQCLSAVALLLIGLFLWEGARQESKKEAAHQ
jgi:hypothetical protein